MLSKSQARAFFLGGTGVFSLAFLGLTYDSHKQVPKQTNEDKLTEQVIRGKKIWEKNNCMGCHTLFGEGAYYAPELTKVVERRGKDWMRLFLKDPQAMFPGERKMTDYDFSDEQIEDVIAFFEWCGNVDLNGFPAKPPLGRVAAPIVTTGKSDVPQPELFKTICIACHSVGGVGGIVGPALDQVGTRIEREPMKDWIRDPQKIKPGTPMPQIPMTPEQLDEIVDYLQGLSNNQ
ncbi:MAG: c-type cytochrome [Luteolibacter sp.]